MFSMSKRRKIVGAIETEIETAIEIVTVIVRGTVTEIMTLNVMTGMRRVEVPAAALDNRALVAPKKTIVRERIIGRPLTIGNGMMTTEHQRRRTMAMGIVTITGIMAGVGRKFAEVVD